MHTWTQDNRHIAIQSPLGKDVLLLRAFTLKEELSRPFECDADLRSQSASIDFNKIIGQPVVIRLNVSREGAGTRYVHGFVSDFEQKGDPVEGASNRYRATIVPWLWFLSRTTDCRIYQNQTVPEVVQAVFAYYKFSAYELRLTGSYAKREYVVQYRESAFNFVSRLLEHEGIYYYFEHAEDRHVMILTDSPAKQKSSPGYEDVEYIPTTPRGLSMERLWEWRAGSRVSSGRFATTDFDFKAPTKSMLVEKAAMRSHANAEYEAFDYPGGYTALSQGQQTIGVRAEEDSAAFRVAQGTGDARGLYAGCKFNLKRYARADQNVEHVVTAATIRAATDDYDTGSKGTDEPAFEVSIRAIPASVPFRPERSTPRPRVGGPQTAIVVGPDGEEVHTDPYGRVKVHFHWDRYGSFDENASCWVRVSSVWAGKKWGFLTLPRIGQEVVVDFLEGDPDQPLITGRVYNADNMPPYKLPDNKSVSTWKSNSTKGGGGFNEIKFEDKKGEELVFVHAEKDRTVVVNHDNSESVGNNESVSVASNRSKSVGGNETTSVGQNRTETVGQNEAVTIGANRTHTVGANDTQTVGANNAVTVGANQAVTVGANQAITAGGSQSTTVALMQNNMVGLLRTSTTGLIEMQNAGLVEEISAGLVLTLNAGVMLSLVGPGGSITIGSSGIHIKGKKVLIEGDRVDINP